MKVEITFGSAGNTIAGPYGPYAELDKGAWGMPLK